MSAAVRVLLAGEMAPGTEETFTNVIPKLGEEDVETVPAAAECAVQASGIAMSAGG